MASYEDDDSRASAFLMQQLEEEARFSSITSRSEEDALIEKFANVVLKPREEPSGGPIVDDDQRYDSFDTSRQLPLRPYAEDCNFYLRNGTCKFGSSCRFNHPVRRIDQQVMPRKDQEGMLEKLATIECKYYLTPGGCKYGESCRFNHSKKMSEIAAPELNFLGLPIRLGERECPFYMRTGSCGYGAVCMFHHPDPISIGYVTYDPISIDETIGQLGNSVLYGNDGSMGSERGRRSSSLFVASNDTSPILEKNYQDEDASNIHQGSFPQPSSAYNYKLVTDAFERSETPVQFEEFPQRPGQPECHYFMKTGNCKFKSACHFNHPKDQTITPEICLLSDKGLPLRPGKNICRHYERLGICKFGPACLFDHPLDLPFPSPDSSS